MAFALSALGGKMGFKQDVVMLLLKHGAEGIMKYFAYRDAEREVLRINSTRFPDYEFHLVPTKHKRLDELLDQGALQASAGSAQNVET